MACFIIKPRETGVKLDAMRAFMLIVVLGQTSCYNIVTYEPLACRRKRDRLLYSGRCYAAAVNKQEGNGAFASFAKQQLHCNRGTEFSVRSVQIFVNYK